MTPFQTIIVSLLVTLIVQQLPALWKLAKPYANQAAGWLPKGFAAGLVLGIVIGGLPVLLGGVKWPTINWPSIPNIVAPADKPDRVTYVYEKDGGGIPAGVAAALSKLNTQGIIATTFEEDTTDGSGETPEQYKLAKAEATKAGLPALVVQAGDKAVRVVKGPTTEEHVNEAISL